MAIKKKSKKAKQPFTIRVIKIITIGLCSALLLAAIAQRLIHYYRHIAK